jgi:putative spermidine/putrescine transport system ATP-binding protein
VLIGDQDVTALPPQDRDIAMVFQSYALYPHMSVRQNLAFGLRMRGAAPTAIADRVAQAAAALGLDAVLERKPSQLSGGQRQRVALGRAMVRDPKVFLFDEPLSNLDAKLRVETRAELARLHRRLGATIVYVTHDQEEALTLSDRIAVFSAGRIEQVGTAREVYESPASAFVAGFVGTSNLLTGETARAVMGREGSVAIRPEKLAVVPAEGARAAEGQLSAAGSLEEVVYGGPVTRYVVALDAGGRLTALEQNTGARADGAALRRGDRVALRWRSEHVIDVPGAPTPELQGQGTSPQQFPTT